MGAMEVVAYAGNGSGTITLSIPKTSAALRGSSCARVRLAQTRLLVLASQDASAGDVVAAAPEDSEEARVRVTDILRSSALETPSYSLISYANIQKAFKGEALSTPDHYAILGLAPGATYQEVETAFRLSCEALLQQGLEEEEIQKRLQILRDSHDILSSEKERRLYDWSLLQLSNSDGVYAWPYEADITQSECDSGPGMPPVDEEGVRKVQNFFLGWLALSVVLNLLIR
ncbi:hypothetical protein KP509_01G130500 [Ceratopteris richardii]|uniref:J domain-containing protein n=1 Tax=Ceratopteris richardii TaxID=49495 RepID=A0A8T2VHH2_CERRI|nr:hypothetical protein KP509_01G130500 [Ceratopteris richardii]